MAHFHPPLRPDFLAEKWRDAECAVWESFQRLDNSWHVFYSARENSGSGRDREIDFVLIRLNRIFYCEVKGGVVVVDQRAAPGVTWAHSTRSGEPIQRRVDPTQLWNAKRALEATIRQIAECSPRDFGFREHDFYYFSAYPQACDRRAEFRPRLCPLRIRGGHCGPALAPATDRGSQQGQVYFSRTHSGDHRQPGRDGDQN